MTTITPATEDDIARILEIAECSISPAWTYASVKERLGRDDTVLLVASDTSARATDAQPAPSAATGFAAFRQVGDDGELLQIAVHPTRRRSGVGSLLLKAALDYASIKSLSSVFLEVRANNEPAIALYKKFGFEELRVRKAYYSDPPEDAIVMAKKL